MGEGKGIENWRLKIEDWKWGDTKTEKTFLNLWHFVLSAPSGRSFIISLSIVFSVFSAVPPLRGTRPYRQRDASLSPTGRVPFFYSTRRCRKVLLWISSNPPVDFSKSSSQVPKLDLRRAKASLQKFPNLTAEVPKLDCRSSQTSLQKFPNFSAEVPKLDCRSSQTWLASS